MGGLTKHGLKSFYLDNERYKENVLHEALERAIEIIEDEQNLSSEFARYVYNILQKIEPMTRYDESRRMVVKESNTTGIHLTGGYPLIKDEPISIWGESNNFYCGIGYYSRFMDVYYPKETLREQTQEEIEKWGK